MWFPLVFKESIADHNIAGKLGELSLHCNNFIPLINGDKNNGKGELLGVAVNNVINSTQLKHCSHFNLTTPINNNVWLSRLPYKSQSSTWRSLLPMYAPVDNENITIKHIENNFTHSDSKVTRIIPLKEDYVNGCAQRTMLTHEQNFEPFYVEVKSHKRPIINKEQLFVAI